MLFQHIIWLIYLYGHCPSSLPTSRSSYRRCFIKKVVLKISQNSQENTCARVSFLLNLLLICNFIIKEILAQVFSCEFCKFFKNPFLQTASGWLPPHIWLIWLYWSYPEPYPETVVLVVNWQTLFIRDVCQIYSTRIISSVYPTCLSMLF